MRFFFLGHLGLGDHYCLTGLVYYLLKGADEVKVVCKTPNLPTLQTLYAQEPRITFHPIDSDSEISPHYGADPAALQRISAEGYTVIAVGTHGRNAHSYLCLDPCWANCFYKELGLDPALRFKLWVSASASPIIKSKAESLWRSVLHALYNQDYIIIHDDPSRDFILPYEHVYRSLKQHGLLHLPVLYLGKDRYNHPLAIGLNNPTHVAPLLEADSALAFTVLMRHARALYMMDSSMAILHDLESPHTPNQVRVSYMKYDILPTDTGLYQGQWEYSKVNP